MLHSPLPPALAKTTSQHYFQNLRIRNAITAIPEKTVLSICQRLFLRLPIKIISASITPPMNHLNLLRPPQLVHQWFKVNVIFKESRILVLYLTLAFMLSSKRPLFDLEGTLLQAMLMSKYH